MSTPQNIDAVNANTNENTQRYFNNYFHKLSTLSADQDDAVIAYFEKQTNGNKSAAKVLASAVVYTSLQQNVDPMSTLDQFMRMPQGDLNAYLTMFLNLNRVGTSLLGINNQPIINKYTKRSIIA